MELLMSNRRWVKWSVKNFCTGDPPPTEYPCFAESLLGSDENPYARFIYIADLEWWLNELQKAKELI